MKKKYYDFCPDAIGMVFTSLFSILTVLLLLSSGTFNGSLTGWQSVNKHAFLFTPAGLLIVMCCMAIVVLAIVNRRHQILSAYLMVPIGVAGVLFALRPILIQGDVSLFLELSGIHLAIALVRGLLGLAVVAFLFLLVTNVVPDKRILVVCLLTAILWYFATEGFLYQKDLIDSYPYCDENQTSILLGQVAFYFAILFYTFSIKATEKRENLLSSIHR